MQSNQNAKRDNPNIGQNTKWDITEVDPNAGSTVSKPSTSLDPDKNPKK